MPARLLPSNPDIHFRLYADYKKDEVLVRTVKRREIIQDVIEKKRDLLIEKKNDFVKDMREKKTKVREKMEEVIERENILTIPNILTVCRGLLAPYVGYVIVQGDFPLAVGLLIIAGISDLVITVFV